ncbi:MAG: response regulator, partial [Sulfurimonas sp.]|nr:response regulator [Sulfurimonas sp.]
TVLIADDIELNRNLIKEYLQNTPLVILEAKDGQEAVDAVKENEIDLVLMDIRMPNKDGYEATREIKEFKDMPVMAITASVVSTKEGKENKIFDDFLHKPVKSEVLMDSMCKFLKCEIKDIEQTSNEKQHLEDVSISEYPKLQELLKRAKSEGDMELIQEFAHEIEKIAKENKSDELKTISTQILSAVDSFDIGECEILLSRFKD